MLCHSATDVDGQHMDLLARLHPARRLSDVLCTIQPFKEHMMAAGIVLQTLVSSVFDTVSRHICHCTLISPDFECTLYTCVTNFACPFGSMQNCVVVTACLAQGRPVLCHCEQQTVQGCMPNAIPPEISTLHSSHDPVHDSSYRQPNTSITL